MIIKIFFYILCFLIEVFFSKDSYFQKSFLFLDYFLVFEKYSHNNQHYSHILFQKQIPIMIHKASPEQHSPKKYHAIESDVVLRNVPQKVIIFLPINPPDL